MNSDERRVAQRIQRLQKKMTEFLVRFCSIATVNPPGAKYGECAEFLAAALGGMGLAARIVRVPPAVQERELPNSRDCPRMSVVARWDVGASRTLHFTGHYDVVPPTAGWKTDPFKPVIAGRRLIARGADDMKSSLTAAVFAVRAIVEAGVRPPWNIELSATPDEETGGYLGLGHLVRSGAIKPDAAVLCEGGSGQTIGYAHKGVLWLDVTVLGKPAHASNPKAGVNALEKACDLIQRLKTLEALYAGRKTAFKMRKPSLRSPTIMFGGLAGGGSKVNTIPDRFHFTIDRRVLPEERLAAVKAEIMAVIRRAERADRKLKVRVRQLLYVPPGWADVESDIARIAQAAVRDVTGKRPRFRMTSGFTDMHFLTQEAHVPTVMYGVSGGGAHADGEYTKIPAMLDTARVYSMIALRLP